ncbi:molybdopterin-binding protein [Desulfonema magnum]|uniref:Molybdopterin molybdenumtransferase n=1 Tax=Desulfonema magnum TaxID=45655 RepID=A0A975BRK6_9BACT|nr:molybdopterin-binding protein [Desulfonema magnum]QTA90391.1 Putative molybdopterin binding domain-containing protein [Desulfonema magnum]
MKKVKVEDAVGMVLAHDLTRIVPGEFKGPGFKKGHVVRKEDIPELMKMGKNHIFILDLSDTHLHENDAALRIAEAMCGENIRWTEPSEGKSAMISNANGLLKINTHDLLRVNKMDNIIVSTLKNNFPCQKDQTVAATRIIPLTIEREKIENLESMTRETGPIIRILPYRTMKVGAIITGTEVYKGLIKDEFDEFVGYKVREYGSELLKKILVPDDIEAISEAIRELRDLGCDVILTTGGLSVDPDDVTRLGVQQSGADIIVYGSPILPGAMFLYALLDGMPIVGLPACVYYHHITIFDLVFPRVLAGDEITRDKIAELGHGGMCMNCDVCRYPVCPFGK